MEVQLFNGDCLEVMRGLADNSVDSIVTDPPAGIAFMNKEWDKNKGGRDEWIAWMTEVMTECNRVLKHGGHALVWTLPRTQHWTALACEDAGFELRDNIIHIFGSGFPKSLSISKQIDKEAGAVREVVGINTRSGKERGTYGAMAGESFETVSATDNAKQWDGWGTALKPAYENWLLLRKPLSEKTVAKNVIKHGTGGINIDGCRVGTERPPTTAKDFSAWREKEGRVDSQVATPDTDTNKGRFPANLIHDGSDEVMALFPDTQASKANARNCSGTPSVAKGKEYPRVSFGHNDSGGSASRFFKCCPSDEICFICSDYYAKAGINDIISLEFNKGESSWKNILVNCAEKNGWTTQAIKEFIARVNVVVKHGNQIALNVRSAESLCDSCGTLIAVYLVGIKSLDFKKEELQVIQDCIGSYKNSTLIQSLVSFADVWESTDIIPTTQSLSILFGYVRHATEKNIKQDIAGKVVQKSEHSQFLYCAKASKADRNSGCDGLELTIAKRTHSGGDDTRGRPVPENKNHHPTVKPHNLMRYLCRLITPPNGIILDPFTGSGSTGKAAIAEGFRFIGIEKEKDFFDIAIKRIQTAQHDLINQFGDVA